MQTVISPAKDMASIDEVKDRYMSEDAAIMALPKSRPMFWDAAVAAAGEMAGYSEEEISGMLKCSWDIAALNKRRYACFGTDYGTLAESAALLPASVAYSGVAYRHLLAESLSQGQMVSARRGLWIVSFLYGLLRPMDGILPYRMEGNVRLDVHQGMTVFDYWKPLLTDILLDSVKGDDGVLLWCSTEEMKRMTDWKRIVSEVRVIEPVFYVRKDGKLKAMSVFAKMCRGAMARLACTGQLSPDSLAGFEYNGFSYDSEMTAPDGRTILVFVK